MKKINASNLKDSGVIILGIAAGLSLGVFTAKTVGKFLSPMAASLLTAAIGLIGTFATKGEAWKVLSASIAAVPALSALKGITSTSTNGLLSTADSFVPGLSGTTYYLPDEGMGNIEQDLLTLGNIPATTAMDEVSLLSVN